MVIVPFSEIPHHAAFRCRNKWWKKQVGTSNVAVPFGEDGLPAAVGAINFRQVELVVIPESRLESKISTTKIKVRFKTPTKK